MIHAFNVHQKIYKIVFLCHKQYNTNIYHCIACYSNFTPRCSCPCSSQSTMLWDAGSITLQKAIKWFNISNLDWMRHVFRKYTPHNVITVPVSFPTLNLKVTLKIDMPVQKKDFSWGFSLFSLVSFLNIMNFFCGEKNI